MRRLLTLLLLGTLAFLAISMTQEWRVFARSLGLVPPESETVAEPEGQAALAALREALAFERHYYGSGGDPRFLDRMPAGHAVLDELTADVDYLTRNGRYQEPTLMEIEILGLRRLAPEAVEIRTKEYWIVRTRLLADGSESEPARAEVSYLRYLMVREGERWRLESRDPGDPPGGVAPD